MKTPLIRLLVCALLAIAAGSAYGRGVDEGRLRDAGPAPSGTVLAADANVLSDGGILPANYTLRPPRRDVSVWREYVTRDIATIDTNPLNAKLAASIDRLHIAMPGLKDLVREFGSPTRLVFTEDRGATYLNVYYAAVDFFYDVSNTTVCQEIRFEGMEWPYSFRQTLHVTSTMDAVFSVLGKPPEIILQNAQQIVYNGAGVRFFFDDRGVVTAMYLFKAGSRPPRGGGSPGATPGAPTVIVEPFADVRNLKLARAVDSLSIDVLRTLTFNLGTGFEGPVARAATRVLEEGRNPGLGIRALHTEGVTGTGVNVAIIDQNLPGAGHPEYSGKVTAYYDAGTGQPRDSGSMHGPAVLSLLVGETAGAAPGARVYYAAAPSWTGNAAYYADALRWLIDQNKNLPKGRRIRVVSVSAAPSGPGSPFYGGAEWDRAVKEATRAGMLVLDCTQTYGLIGPAYYDPSDPESVQRSTPGFPGMSARVDAKYLLAPASYRSVAESYQAGVNSWQYTGRGGLSWAIPWTAGVLAMGWQVNPDLDAREMMKLLGDTAYLRADGARIIDPKAFVAAVRKNVR